jgi:uncharacterized protein (TIGR01244 family)
MCHRKRAVFLLLSAIGLVVTGCSDESRGGTPSARTEAITRPADPVALTVEGLKNARKTGDLLFGGQPDEATIKRLAAEGYRTIVSTRGTGELSWDQKAVVEAAGMSFVFIAMDKPVKAITDEQVAAFAEVMNTAQRPMLLHCSTGNRTAGLWAVWLAERQGVEPAEALRLGALAGMTKSRSVVEKRLAGR